MIFPQLNLHACFALQNRPRLLASQIIALCLSILLTRKIRLGEKLNRYIFS